MIVKYVRFGLLGMATAVLIIFGFGNSVNLPGLASTPNVLAQQSADLTQQGHQYFAGGNPEAALQNWQEAEEIYDRLSHTDGIMGSRINQSLALQAMGQSRRACKTLLVALNLDAAENDLENLDLCEPQPKGDFPQFEPSDLNTIGLRNLGDVLRSIGNLDLSETVLQRSFNMAETLHSQFNMDAAMLSLANTHRSQFDRWRDTSDRTEMSADRTLSIQFAEQALNSYEILKTSKDSIRVRAEIDRLDLLVELKTWLELLKLPEFEADKLRSFNNAISPSMNEILEDRSFFENFTPIEAIYARLTLAHSLNQLHSDMAFSYAEEAFKQAKDLKNLRTQAYALGVLGRLYESQNQDDLARDRLKSALDISQGIQAWDLAYQWEHQLGKIYRKGGEFNRAIDYYTAATNSLDRVSKDLLSIAPDVQFSFQETVKPVYEELLDLLLRSPQPNPHELQTAIEINQQFQTAELENFLRCTFNDDRASTRSEVSPNSPDAIVRIIILEDVDRAIEIVETPKVSSTPFYHNLKWSDVKSNIGELRYFVNTENFFNTDSQKFQSYSQDIYQKLIAPLRDRLPPEGTLVFILDSALQNIPLGMLQDENEHYLIEQYSMALNFAKPIPDSDRHFSKLEVLAGGLGIESPSFQIVLDRFDLPFNPLPNVREELTQIENSASSTIRLDDENFTHDEFQKKLNYTNFPIIHIATHGYFSSDPDKTFILTYDNPITLKQLDLLLRDRSEGSFNAIDLLVLSACQTAKDDERGGLGLAGLAVKSGAQSTVASLWNISDRSTVEFMKEFYQALSNPNITKAEALRDAQLTFLKNSKYKHPYYWAAFVLVGNWR
jgi:CHAT domain-containing protein